MICFVDGKSTRARAGIVVHLTAPTIHTSWVGKVTLEFVNLGPFDLVLQEDDVIAQLPTAGFELTAHQVWDWVRANRTLVDSQVFGAESAATEAQRRGFSLRDLTTWLCSNPARQVSLGARKGTIAEGYDADIVIWNPQRAFTVDASNLEHRHKLTPYHGESLSGTVEKTFLRGRKIYDEGFAKGPVGQLLI